VLDQEQVQDREQVLDQEQVLVDKQVLGGAGAEQVDIQRTFLQICRCST
jgi:hypothetical protein